MAGLLRGMGRNSPRGSSPEAVSSLGGFRFWEEAGREEAGQLKVKPRESAGGQSGEPRV